VSVEGDHDGSSPRELVGIKGGVFFASMCLWALSSCTTHLLTESEEMGQRCLRFRLPSSRCKA
jgi:hypothetical protein